MASASGSCPCPLFGSKGRGMGWAGSWKNTSGPHLPPGFLPLSVASRVRRPREEHEDLIAKGPPRGWLPRGCNEGFDTHVQDLSRREELHDLLQLGVGSFPPRDSLRCVSLVD